MSELVGPEARRLFEEILQQQERKGIDTYGHVLSTENGRDALLDALQEAVDLFQYLTQARMENERLRERVAALEAAVRIERRNHTASLGNYGRHKRYCGAADIQNGLVVIIGTGPCTCGMSAILSALSAQDASTGAADPNS